jgi:ABC-type phosphate/phosphonate transport system ATPase subunit
LLVVINTSLPARFCERGVSDDFFLQRQKQYGKQLIFVDGEKVGLVGAGALSGRWKMAVALTRVLLPRLDLLLMDEAANLLDIESARFLRSADRRENMLENRPTISDQDLGGHTVRLQIVPD